MKTGVSRAAQAHPSCPPNEDRGHLLAASCTAPPVERDGSGARDGGESREAPAGVTGSAAHGCRVLGAGCHPADWPSAPPAGPPTPGPRPTPRTRPRWPPARRVTSRERWPGSCRPTSTSQVRSSGPAAEQVSALRPVRLRGLWRLTESWKYWKTASSLGTRPSHSPSRPAPHPAASRADQRVRAWRPRQTEVPLTITSQRGAERTDLPEVQRNVVPGQRGVALRAKSSAQGEVTVTPQKAKVSAEYLPLTCHKAAIHKHVLRVSIFKSLASGFPADGLHPSL